MPTSAMIEAARRAMQAVLDLRDTDRVLVLGDDVCGRCPDAFAAAAREVGCEVRQLKLPTDPRPLTALPPGMENALDGVTVVVNAIDGRSDEVPFRIEWIQAIEAQGCIRMGHAPGIDESMMTGGAMDVDYEAMARRAERLLELLAGARRLRLTSVLGTDLELGIEGRDLVSDLKATVECGCNLPCGELYCAPVEDDAHGTLVVDGPIGGDGVPPAPVTITVKDGEVDGVLCENPAWATMVRGYMGADAGASVIAELGIGLNPGARLAGRMLEDEKALRTLHVAFGSNEGMPGGMNTSRMHIDYLVHRPTIEVIEGDRPGTLVLVDGDLAGS